MDRFDRAYFNALKAVTKKHRRSSKGQRVPASQRAAFKRAAIEIAEKKTNYRRDGQKHVMRGIPGNALVYMFSRRPTAEEWSDPDDRGTYLRNNGIFIAQVTDVRGYFPDDPEYARERRYDVQSWSGSFADIEDYLHRYLPNALIGPIRQNRAGRSFDLHALAEMNGDQLMSVALDILGYGAGVESSHHRTFKDALTAAEDTSVNF